MHNNVKERGNNLDKAFKMEQEWVRWGGGGKKGVEKIKGSELIGSY